MTSYCKQTKNALHVQPTPEYRILFGIFYVTLFSSSALWQIVDWLVILYCADVVGSEGFRCDHTEKLFTIPSNGEHKKMQHNFESQMHMQRAFACTACCAHYWNHVERMSRANQQFNIFLFYHFPELFSPFIREEKWHTNPTTKKSGVSFARLYPRLCVHNVLLWKIIPINLASVNSNIIFAMNFHNTHPFECCLDHFSLNKRANASEVLKSFLRRRHFFFFFASINIKFIRGSE